MTDKNEDEYVYIVHEEPHGDIHRVFDNEGAADNYVDDAEQTENMFIIQCRVEGEYEQYD